MKKCCENYNGTLDITNSCIFCKTYLEKDIKEYTFSVEKYYADFSRYLKLYLKNSDRKE